MGPESHSAINSAMLPKEMAGSGQEWHKSDKESWWGGGGEGRGRVGAGRLAGKLLLCMASENNIYFFLPMRYEIVQKTAVLTKCEISWHPCSNPAHIHSVCENFLSYLFYKLNKQDNHGPRVEKVNSETQWENH